MAGKKKKAVICWELGAGLGHLNPIYQVAEELIRRQYDVWVLCKDLGSVHRVFKNVAADPDTRRGTDGKPGPEVGAGSKAGLQILQGPNLSPLAPQQAKSALCFADLLWTVGYHNPQQLKTVVMAWRALFDLIAPDVVFYDHSPTALLASADYSFKKVYLGSTFSCPPSSYPMGLFDPAAMQQAKAAEDQVMDVINSVNDSLGLPEIKQLQNLFDYYDYKIFTTVPNLDHYRGREVSKDEFFVSVDSFHVEKQVEWPAAGKTKVFGYLKSGQYLKKVLSYLIKSQCCTCLYIDGRFEIKQALPPNIKLINYPVSMPSVVESADVVLSNANLNTVIYLADKPVKQMVIPLSVEQGMLARTLVEKKLAAWLNPDTAASVEELTESVISGNKFVVGKAERDGVGEQKSAGELLGLALDVVL